MRVPDVSLPVQTYPLPVRTLSSITLILRDKHSSTKKDLSVSVRQRVRSLGPRFYRTGSTEGSGEPFHFVRFCR